MQVGFHSSARASALALLFVIVAAGILIEMKDFFVEDAVRFENATVTTYFVLSSMQVRDKKQGGQYLALIVSDKTGSLEARMWDEVADPIEFCSEGCYVKVQGEISKYNGKFQITLKKLRLAADSEIDPTDFQPSTKFDVEEMWAELRGYVSAFRNEDLKRLVFSFLDDERIGPAFKTCSGGEAFASCVAGWAAGACVDAGAGLSGDGAVLSGG